MKPKTSQAAVLWVVLSLGVFFTLAMSASTEAQNLMWAKRAGGTGDDYWSRIAVDGSGNSYVTGSFEGSATFGPGEVNETTLTDGGFGGDMFVAKYNSTGLLQWAKQAIDAWGGDIAVDGSGNSYVTGGFYGPATFGPGEANETTLTGEGFFVAKYNSSGLLQWAKRAGGTGYAYGYRTAADNSGNSFVMGHFTGSVTFGPGEANETTLIESGLGWYAGDIFVAKYNSSGALQWAKQVLPTDYLWGSGIALDSLGNSYVAGDFYISATFGPGELKETTLSPDGQFVAKYDSSGALVWAKRVVDTGDDVGFAVDGSGNSYVAGGFDGSRTFGPGDPNETTLTSTGGIFASDIFVAKFDSNGALLWARRAGGPETDYGWNIAVDGSGNSYVTGLFDADGLGGSATFGPGEANETTLTSAGFSNIFVAKYNSSGALVWAKQIEGTDLDWGPDIAVDGSGNSYVTGYFGSSATFGPGEANETPLTSAGFGDIFLAKFAGDEVAPPDTIINSGPAAGTGGTTNSTSAQFTFTSNPAGGTFTCSLDGSPFAACTSPKNYNSLADGGHNFLVRATDAFSNTDPTPANYDWTVDTVAPNTVINFSPAALTNSTSATFQFTSTEAGTFQCNLDSGGFTACTTPKTYNGLTEGAHTFQVRAIDAVNNTDPTPASFNWTIDLTPSNTVIDSAPANPTESTNASFSFYSTETGSSFQCQLDSGSFSECTSPKNYAGLTVGAHTFAVRATDGAGNPDTTPASFNWTILGAPDTIINTGPAADGGATNSTTAVFNFTLTDPSATFVCSLDNGAFSACTTPKTHTKLKAGNHNFRVQATAGGATDPTPAIFNWTIDKTAPNTTITLGPPVLTNNSVATFTFTSTEAGGGYLCSLDGGPFAPCTSPFISGPLADGKHNFQVKATDAAGNMDKSPAKAKAWTVDATPPDTALTATPANPTTSTSATFKFTSTEKKSTFQCNLDGAGFSPCKSGQAFSGLLIGAHNFQVRAIDGAGNVDPTPAIFNWTAPGQTQTLNQPALTANDANVIFTDIGGGIVQVTFNGVFNFSAIGGTAQSYSGTFLYDTAVPPDSVVTPNPDVTIANYSLNVVNFSVFGSSVTPLHVSAQIHDGSGIYNDGLTFQVTLDSINNFGVPIPGTAAGLIAIGINSNAFPGIMLTSAAFPKNLSVFSSANLGVSQFAVVSSQ